MNNKTIMFEKFPDVVEVSVHSTQHIQDAEHWSAVEKVEYDSTRTIMLSKPPFGWL